MAGRGDVGGRSGASSSGRGRGGGRSSTNTNNNNNNNNNNNGSSNIYNNSSGGRTGTSMSMPVSGGAVGAVGGSSTSIRQPSPRITSVSVQPPIKCGACKQIFTNKTELFAHLDENPDHKQKKTDNGGATIGATPAAKSKATSNSNSITSSYKDTEDYFDEPATGYKKKPMQQATQSSGGFQCSGCQQIFRNKTELFAHLDENPDHKQKKADTGGATTGKYSSSIGATPAAKSKATSNSYSNSITSSYTDTEDHYDDPATGYKKKPVQQATQSSDGSRQIRNKTEPFEALTENPGHKQEKKCASILSTVTPAVLAARAANSDILNRKLCDAAEKGDLEEIIRLTRHLGAQVDGVDEKSGNMYTPLAMAASKGHVPVCEYLIGAGANKERADKYGMTPLSLASIKGYLTVFKLLVGAGSNMEHVDMWGRTPLALAASNGHFHICEFLIGAGANVERADKDGRTALSYASIDGHLPVCELLIRSGAKPHITATDGMTPLAFAAKNGHLPVCELLIGAGADKAHASKSGYTPLSWAAKNGYLRICEVLVGAAYIERPDEGGKINTPMKMNRPVKRNAPVKMDTPLALAYLNGHLPVCEYLIGAEANVGYADEDGRTLLSWAASDGHLRICELLIGAGAEIDHTSNLGNTPLALAYLNRHLPVCEYLIGVGANTEIVDKWGNTPLLWAAKNGNLRMCELLVGAGACVERPDELGNTPLALAASKSHLPVCEYLIGAGANVGYADETGRSLLHIACESRKIPMVKLLLACGANPHVKTPGVNGRTPRQFAGTTFGFAEGNSGNRKAIEDCIDRWPTIMAILCLQEICLYHWLDMSLIDLHDLIGQEKDFIR